MRLRTPVPCCVCKRPSIWVKKRIFFIVNIEEVICLGCNQWYDKIMEKTAWSSLGVGPWLSGNHKDCD